MSCPRRFAPVVPLAAIGDFRHQPSFSARYPPGWWAAAENIVFAGPGSFDRVWLLVIAKYF